MKPILFSTQMVQTLLNTKPNTYPPEPIDASKPCKGSTRRVVKPQPDDGGVQYATKEYYLTTPDNAARIIAQTEEGESVELKPLYQVGDVLWVRETWQSADEQSTGLAYLYKADGEDYSDWISLSGDKFRWKPSIHMPRKAARIFLKVRNVRVERLREISCIDKVYEGFCDCARAYPCAVTAGTLTPLCGYMSLRG